MIPVASLYRSPVTPVYLILSEPERSTKWILETVFISEFVFLDSIIIIKMQWDLVETSFLGVSQITLLLSPILKCSKASSSFSILKLNF